MKKRIIAFAVALTTVLSAFSAMSVSAETPVVNNSDFALVHIDDDRMGWENRNVYYEINNTVEQNKRGYEPGKIDQSYWDQLEWIPLTNADSSISDHVSAKCKILRNKSFYCFLIDVTTDFDNTNTFLATRKTLGTNFWVQDSVELLIDEKAHDHEPMSVDAAVIETGTDRIYRTADTNFAGCAKDKEGVIVGSPHNITHLRVNCDNKAQAGATPDFGEKTKLVQDGVNGTKLNGTFSRCVPKEDGKGYIYEVFVASYEYLANQPMSPDDPTVPDPVHRDNFKDGDADGKPIALNVITRSVDANGKVYTMYLSGDPAEESRGDITRDGKINIVDAMLVFQYVARGTASSLLDSNVVKADVTMSGKTDVADAMKLFDYVANDRETLGTKTEIAGASLGQLDLYRNTENWVQAYFSTDYITAEENDFPVVNVTFNVNGDEIVYHNLAYGLSLKQSSKIDGLNITKNGSEVLSVKYDIVDEESQVKTNIVTKSVDGVVELETYEETLEGPVAGKSFLATSTYIGLPIIPAGYHWELNGSPVDITRDTVFEPNQVYTAVQD